MNAIQQRTLERRARLTLTLAAQAGEPITYLGITPLFDEHRLYRGEGTDWVLSPAERDPQHTTGPILVPKTERARLQRLTQSGVCFARLYIAHEIPKGTLELESGRAGPEASVLEEPGQGALLPRSTGHVVGETLARAAVGPVPVHGQTARLSANLGYLAEGMVNLLRGAAAGTASAVRATGAGIATVATTLAHGVQDLDPVIFGAMTTHGRLTVGEPAAYFVLAQWTW